MTEVIACSWLECSNPATGVWHRTAKEAGNSKFPMLPSFYSCDTHKTRWRVWQAIREPRVEGAVATKKSKRREYATPVTAPAVTYVECPNCGCAVER